MEKGEVMLRKWIQKRKEKKAAQEKAKKDAYMIKLNKAVQEGNLIFDALRRGAKSA